MGNNLGIYSPGDAVDSVFPVSGATGVGVNADSTPTMSVWKNGVVDGAVTVTLSNPSTGLYRFQFTIPSGYALGDSVRVQAQATVGGIVLPPSPVFETRLSSSIASRAVAGDAMALTGGERTTLYTGIWANGTRTLTGFGTLVADVAAAVWAAGARTLTAISDSAGITTLLDRLSALRAGYLDNLNTSGIVASQADITALNQSASRRMVIACVSQMERPESGSSTYTVEMRTYDADGAATNATGTPTIVPTGIVSGSLAANLSAVSNPATGVYRATYTVAFGHALEQVRFDGSAVMADGTFTLSAYSQVCDFVAATFTTADRTLLTNAEAYALAAKTRTELALPAIAPSNASGLPLKSDLPVAPDNAGIAAGAASAATAAAQSTTAATQATAAAADSLAAKNRVLAGIPNATPGTNPGLALKSDVAGGGGSSAVQYIATPIRSGRREAVRYTRGATGPNLLDHVLDGSGNRINLTGYTITATMIRTGTETAIFTGTAAALGNAPDEGQVVLEWPAAALDTVGEYKLIWIATLSGESVRWTTIVVVE